MINNTSNAINNQNSIAPPLTDSGIIGWLRKNLFSNWINSIITVIIFVFVAKWMVGLIDWGVVNAVWSVPPKDPSLCRAASGTGACWAMIKENYRFILFGTYEYTEQWRPFICILIFISLYFISTRKSLWNRNLFFIWTAGLLAIGILMWGGIFGLTYVEQGRWGGLPITLILSTFGIAAAFPISILLALARRSENLPVIRVMAVTYIELIRGVPLVTVLFMASVLFPLFLPETVSIDKLLRAQIAIIMFASAYLAEVVRGGLQSLPKGQYEAADALGLTYWKKMILIILPQSLKIVIPPLVNTFIGLFKDTSLVLIIGIYDLLNAAKTSIVDPQWRGFGTEAYVTVALIYFVFCYSISKYSQKLERELDRGVKK